MKKYNSPKNCPKCEQEFTTLEDVSAIIEWGMCLGCEHINAAEAIEQLACARLRTQHDY